MMPPSGFALAGWGDGGEAWQWCRGLWVWEEELLEECRLLLLMFLCSLFLMMCGSGFWIPPKGILFVVCMLCSLIRRYRRIGRMLT